MKYFGNIIENNGKTIKENNNAIKHTIPLGALVEILTWDSESEEKYGGLRLFVVELSRDCDGTPLYGVSYDRTLIGKTNQEHNKYDAIITQFINFANNHNILRGFDEYSLKIIKRRRNERLI